MENGLTGLMTDWMPFATLAKVSILIQIGMVVHVIKTGRPYWWIWILLIAPFIGGLVYFLAEIVPDLRRPGMSSLWDSIKPRSWRIRQLKQGLEEVDTFDARIQLAEVLLENGDPLSARTVADEGLSGVFLKDPAAKAEVAYYRLESGDAKGALELLELGKIEGDRFLEVRIRFLHGRALIGIGQHQEALGVLEQCQTEMSTEAPRFFYAEALHLLGRNQEARDVLDAIKQKYRKGNRAWRHSEKRWYRESKELLKQVVT